MKNLKSSFLLLPTIVIMGCGQFSPKENIEGLFTKGFETYEIKTKSGETLHVVDPKHYLDPLITDALKMQPEEKLWLTFSICLEGQLSSKGKYGHMGSYSQQIKVTGLCKSNGLHG